MKLTESEEDFARWMEELDLEEVNLLQSKPRPSPADAYGQRTQEPSNALRGEGKPALGLARDTGWKAD